MEVTTLDDSWFSNAHILIVTLVTALPQLRAKNFVSCRVWYRNAFNAFSSSKIGKRTHVSTRPCCGIELKHAACNLGFRVRCSLWCFEHWCLNVGYRNVKSLRPKILACDKMLVFTNWVLFLADVTSRGDSMEIELTICTVLNRV